MLAQVMVESRLFSYGVLDEKDDLDEMLEKRHAELSTLLSNLRENEVYEQLNAMVCRSTQEHGDATSGLLYSLLTEPVTASKMYSTLALVSRDGMSSTIQTTEMVVMEKMRKLNDVGRQQVLWLIRELIQTGVLGADRLCFALLKQMPGSSTSQTDIWLIESVMHLLLDNKKWLESQSGLVESVVFTYLSLIPYHTSSQLAGLRHQEAKFCVSLIRDNFMVCMAIGRDLLRLLLNVAKIPEFTELWKDLLQQPEKLNCNFEGVLQIFNRRTSRRFMAGRILPDIETKLNFFLSKVKFGQHKKYQEWFQKKYLLSPESFLHISELIRFICSVIHPTNEVLGSEVMPRWALVGWLLSLCQGNPEGFAAAKFAIFYDWLFYNPEVDNIMNIEPAVLLIFHSLRSHPQISATLLEFLCNLITDFSPDLEQHVRAGIKAAMNDILQKGVMPSFEPIFHSPKLDVGLKDLLKRSFPEFCVTETSFDNKSVPQMETQEVNFLESTDPGFGDQLDEVLQLSDEELQGEDDEVTRAFSESEDEPLGEESKVGFQVIQEGTPSDKGSSNVSSVDPWSRLCELPTPCREKLQAMNEESEWSEMKLKSLNDFLKMFLKFQDHPDIVKLTGPLLADCLSRDFETCSSEEELNFTRPNQILFRQACNKNAKLILQLLGQLSSTLPRVGYFFINFLHSFQSSLQGGIYEPYKNYAQEFDISLNLCLLRDMKECVDNEPSIFYEVIPSLFIEFSQELKGCLPLLSMVVANIDPIQLHSLVERLTLKEFQIFGSDSRIIQDIIVGSLQWDSFEQFCVWQLLTAEGPDCHLVIPALHSLSPPEHPEAITSALLFLKSDSSVFQGVGALLSLPDSSHGSFVEAVLSRWVNSRPAKYAKLISQFIMEKSESLKIELLFLHLERLLKHLNTPQLFEASDCLLSTTLTKQFNVCPDLITRFPHLYRIITEEHKQVTGGDVRRLKTKKRKVLNRQDIIDS